MTLQGKSAIVSGGSIGLGRRIVERFAAYGVDVLFVYRSHHEEAKALEASLADAPARVRAFRADALKAEEVEASAAEALRLFGKIDILVNNIGGSLKGEGPIWKIDEKTFDEVLAYNIKTNFLFTKALVPHFMERRGGSIVNIGSINGLRGREGQPAYSAAKGAVTAFTKAMARELGEYQVNVNLIATGMINNERSQANVNEVAKRNILNLCYIRKYVEPGDIAELAAFLCSDEAKCITGSVYKMDAGEYI